MSPVEDEHVPLVCGPEAGDMYNVWTYLWFRMPDLRRLDEEVDELIGSDVPTIRGRSACTTDNNSVQEVRHFL